MRSASSSGIGCTARNALRQVLALDELHDQGAHVLRLFDAVNGGDVRMIERGEHFRFALKARESIGIGRQRRRKNLERDLTLELGVSRPVDLTHSAFANWRGDFVDADSSAGGQTHVWAAEYTESLESAIYLIDCRAAAGAEQPARGSSRSDLVSARERAASALHSS